MLLLTLGPTRKVIPPRWYKECVCVCVWGGGGGGGGMDGTSLGVFDMLQYFETILPLV